jgi:hypothetical protein
MYEQSRSSARNTDQARAESSVALLYGAWVQRLTVRPRMQRVQLEVPISKIELDRRCLAQLLSRQKSREIYFCQPTCT